MSEVLKFVGAVIGHWQGYVTGGVVTGLIYTVERLTNWKLKRWMFAVLSLGVFLLVSFFLAWRDQYREALLVPVLKSQLEDKDRTIKELREKPAQVQVNLPPPVVSFPPEMAYLGSDSIDLANYKLGEYIAVGTTCRNLSQSIPAQRAQCIRRGFIVDAVPNLQNQPTVTVAVQEKMYNEFEKGLVPLRVGNVMTYGPGEHRFGTAYPAMLDEKLDGSLRAGTKTVLFFAEYSWQDGVGTHANEVCAWLQAGSGASGLFTPGVSGLNKDIVWNYCRHHNGLQPH